MQLTTSEDIKKLGTIVSIWAHPDDESFLAGGVLRAAVLNGQRVVCVTATRGEAGVQDETRWPHDQLATIRTQEMKQALEILGIDSHYWLGCQDGCCDRQSAPEMVKKLVDILKKEKPDTVITFGPNGWTGHPDHKMVAHWAFGAVLLYGEPINLYQVTCSPEHYEKDLKKVDELFDVFFNADKPPLTPLVQCDIHFEMSPEILQTKLAAYRAMTSQSEIMFAALGNEVMGNGLGCETFVKAI